MTIALDQNITTEKVSSFAFQRLVATKFNEEMATQLQDLTAHEFLDCGYGHDIGKYEHGHRQLEPLGSGRRSLPLSPKKREPKILFLTTSVQSSFVLKQASKADTTPA